MGRPTLEEQLELVRLQCPDLEVVPTEDAELRRLRAEIAAETLRELFGGLFTNER